VIESQTEVPTEQAGSGEVSVTSKQLVNGYAGDFLVGGVEGAVGFVLWAETFIVRNNSVGFTFSGSDDPTRGRFHITGTANLSKQEGRYCCEQIPLRYEQEGYDIFTNLDIEVLQVAEVDNKKPYCYVSGKWTDSTGNWVFHGLLPLKDAAENN